MIQIYTGDGKGKTTAAVGAAVRAAGAEGRVLFFQFLKDDSSSEIGILKNIDNIFVLGGFCDLGKVWEFGEDKIKDLAVKYEAKLKEISKIVSDYDMVVLDEIIVAYDLGYINKESVFDFIRDFPDSKELILTGRGADDELIKKADYVSEIKKIKHPYDNGIEAREMIEF